MSTDALKARIDELEFQFAHLQRIYDQLNEVVTEQADGIDRLTRRVTSLETQYAELKQASDATDDPLDEKPPHY